jgi:hypothetical protein
MVQRTQCQNSIAGEKATAKREPDRECVPLNARLSTLQPQSKPLGYFPNLNCATRSPQNNLFDRLLHDFTLHRDQRVSTFTDQRVDQNQGCAFITISEAMVASHGLHQSRHLLPDARVITDIGPCDGGLNQLEIWYAGKAAKIQRPIMSAEGVG